MTGSAARRSAGGGLRFRSARAGRSRRGARRPVHGVEPARAGHAADGGDPMRVAVGDDAVILREGLARLLQEAGFEVVGVAADAEELLELVDRSRAGRRDRRHPHAADAHRRGAASGEGDPRGAPGDRHPRALPARARSLRDRAAVERDRRRRLSAQGARGRPRRAVGERPPRRAGRLGARPGGRQPARRPAPAGRQPARAAHRPRAGGARADGRGPLQQGDRRAAVRLRAHRREAHQEHLRHAAACRSRPTTTGACWRSSPISTRSSSRYARRMRHGDRACSRIDRARSRSDRSPISTTERGRRTRRR